MLGVSAFSGTLWPLVIRSCQWMMMTLCVCVCVSVCVSYVDGERGGWPPRGWFGSVDSGVAQLFRRHVYSIKLIALFFLLCALWRSSRLLAVDPVEEEKYCV